MMLMTIGSLASLPQSITREDLKNGIWLYTESAWYERSYLVYTDSAQISTYAECLYTKKWESVTINHPYYLTDSIPKNQDSYEFDFSKVGKNTKGNYIVEWNDKMKEVYFYKVTHYSGDTIALKSVKDFDTPTFIYKKVESISW